MHTKYLINSRDSEALASKDEARLNSSQAVYNFLHHISFLLYDIRYCFTCLEMETARALINEFKGCLLSLRLL